MSSRRRIQAPGIVGSLLALIVAGCGNRATQSAVATTKTSTSRPSAAAWQPGTPAPTLTPALIAHAGYGLNQANANLGTVDEVFGSMAADVQVDPSAKTLNDQYARFGRCMGEYMKIHDLAHELALLVAYNREDRVAQAAVEKASSVCAGDAITPDAAYKQSLKANP
jgi:hypothetical protein